FVVWLLGFFVGVVGGFLGVGVGGVGVVGVVWVVWGWFVVFFGFGWGVCFWLLSLVGYFLALGHMWLFFFKV
ncbi:hypothetical protein Q8G46_27995, partial [Klebsiella pneumoniae]|uniref:hypothetical protein n=1 Tax=Klebsiella pneumoniae TaxID=573 RepID=UPI003013E59B